MYDIYEMPLSKAHRQAISKGVKAYHARCRACKDEDNTPLNQLQMYKKKKITSTGP